MRWALVLHPLDPLIFLVVIGRVDHSPETRDLVLQEALHSRLECHLRPRSPMACAFQAYAGIRSFHSHEFNIAPIRLQRWPNLGQGHLDLPLKTGGDSRHSTLHWIHGDISSRLPR